MLSITDTYTTIEGPVGEQHMAINIAADRLSDFTKKIPAHRRRNAGRTEFEAMMVFFGEQVEKANAGRTGQEQKKFTQVELKDEQGETEE